MVPTHHSSRHDSTDTNQSVKIAKNLTPSTRIGPQVSTKLIIKLNRKLIKS